MIDSTNPQAADRRYMSISDFAHFGTEQMAYVKPVAINGQKLFAIYAADGQELALIEGRDLADAAVRQNDMEPQSVH